MGLVTLEEEVLAFGKLNHVADNYPAGYCYLALLKSALMRSVARTGSPMISLKRFWGMGHVFFDYDVWEYYSLVRHEDKAHVVPYGTEGSVPVWALAKAAAEQGLFSSPTPVRLAMSYAGPAVSWNWEQVVIGMADWEDCVPVRKTVTLVQARVTTQALKNRYLMIASTSISVVEGEEYMFTLPKVAIGGGNMQVVSNECFSFFRAGKFTNEPLRTLVSGCTYSVRALQSGELVMVLQADIDITKPRYGATPHGVVEFEDSSQFMPQYSYLHLVKPDKRDKVLSKLGSSPLLSDVMHIEKEDVLDIAQLFSINVSVDEKRAVFGVSATEDTYSVVEVTSSASLLADLAAVPGTLLEHSSMPAVVRVFDYEPFRFVRVGCDTASSFRAAWSEWMQASDDLRGFVDAELAYKVCGAMDAYVHLYADAEALGLLAVTDAVENVAVRVARSLEVDHVVLDTYRELDPGMRVQPGLLGIFIHMLSQMSKSVLLEFIEGEVLKERPRAYERGLVLDQVYLLGSTAAKAKPVDAGGLIRKADDWLRHHVSAHDVMHRIELPPGTGLRFCGQEIFVKDKPLWVNLIGSMDIQVRSAWPHNAMRCDSSMVPYCLRRMVDIAKASSREHYAFSWIPTGVAVEVDVNAWNRHVGHDFDLFWTWS